MTPKDKAIRQLTEAGYQLCRHGAKHDMYRNPELRRSIALKRHDFNDNDLKYIQREIRQNERSAT